MQQIDQDYITNLIRFKTGIVLKEDKQYLIETRLTPIASKYNISLDSFLSEIRLARNQKYIDELIDAMTTNETSFFRDKKPFDQFRDVIFPKLDQITSEKKIRIWCAACSSGQEPYSLAMLIYDMRLQERGYQINIVASDISDKALDQAKKGVYNQFEIQRGLPAHHLARFFSHKNGNCWEISANLKKMVEYKKINLLNIPISLGQFHIIYCRNVLLYFDVGDKKKVLYSLAKMLFKEGILFLGGSETVVGLSDRFQEVEKQRGMFKKL